VDLLVVASAFAVALVAVRKLHLQAVAGRIAVGVAHIRVAS
jgi:hypothetical protein